MDKLVEILKIETASLKAQYVEKTREWASQNFYDLRSWAERYASNQIQFTTARERCNASRRYYSLPYEIVNPNGKIEVWVEKAVKYAEDHYENSIEKLASRIEKKGLNIDKLQVKTAHVGVNISTTLTDGEKTVRAFTIVASGEVQRPHYRYLIK